MNDKQDVLIEISRLIEEQSRSLQSRLSPEAVNRCQVRSDRIRKLFQQFRQDQDEVSEQPVSSVLPQSVHGGDGEPFPFESG